MSCSCHYFSISTLCYFPRFCFGTEDEGELIKDLGIGLLGGLFSFSFFFDGRYSLLQFQLGRGAHVASAA